MFSSYQGALFCIFCFLICNISSSLAESSAITKSNLTKEACTQYNSDGTIRPHRVVVFVDSALTDVFLNWLLFYNTACKYDLSHLDVVCMDKRAKLLLRSIGVNCSADSFILGEEGVINEQQLNLQQQPVNLNLSKLGTIWLKRMQLLSQYIASGQDVIFSDSDAIWLKDPLPDISKYGAISDVVSSRAWFPQRLFRKWGASLCMGFIYVRAGSFGAEFTRTMISELNQQMAVNETKPDDQVAANEVLERWNVTWPRKMVVGANSIPDRGVVHRNSSDYYVTLLPHAKYLRKCHSMKVTQILNGIDNATVVHCKLPTGNGKGKAQRLKALSLWKLLDDWKFNVLAAYNKTDSLTFTEALHLLSDSIDSTGALVEDESIRSKQSRLRATISKSKEKAKREKKSKQTTEAYSISIDPSSASNLGRRGRNKNDRADVDRVESMMTAAKERLQAFKNQSLLLRNNPRARKESKMSKAKKILAERKRIVAEKRKAAKGKSVDKLMTDGSEEDEEEEEEGGEGEGEEEVNAAIVEDLDTAEKRDSVQEDEEDVVDEEDVDMEIEKVPGMVSSNYKDKYLLVAASQRKSSKKKVSRSHVGDIPTPPYRKKKTSRYVPEGKESEFKELMAIAETASDETPLAAAGGGSNINAATVTKEGEDDYVEAMKMPITMSIA